MTTIPRTRNPEVPVDAMFPDRWSPRAFLSEPLPVHQIQRLFEAARWAPSCFNEQPWLFLYAADPDAKKRFGSLLYEKNQQWALHAPLLIFVLAKRDFARSGKTNRHAPFDAGAAWVSLAFQARKLGLYAHAMAGFDEKRSYEVLGVSESVYQVMAAVAVGKKGDVRTLPEDLRQMEAPNDRKPISEIAVAVSGER